MAGPVLNKNLLSIKQVFIINAVIGANAIT